MQIAYGNTDNSTCPIKTSLLVICLHNKFVKKQQLLNVVLGTIRERSGCNNRLQHLIKVLKIK